MQVDWQAVQDAVIRWLQTSGLTILVAIIVMTIAVRIAKTLIRRLHRFLETKEKDDDRNKRVNTIMKVVRQIAVSAIWILGLLTILSELGIDIGPILTAVGIIGLAFSFGAQNLVKDVIAGFFMLLENNIRIGDVVSTNGHSGTVEFITLRTTQIRDGNGALHIIPNGSVGTIINKSKDFSRHLFEIGVSYSEDIDRVMEVIQGVGDQLASDPEYAELITEPFDVWGLDKFDDFAVVIKARITTKPLKQWGIAREFNRRLKKKFDELGIEIPFPTHTVINKTVVEKK